MQHRCVACLRQLCDGADVTDQSFETMRRAMVASQLRTNAVNDPRVVAAMATVPREQFVPADRWPVAYADFAVPLGGGRSLNPPMATGRMLTELHPQPTDRALVIGAATGYAAAVLARLVASVVALDTDERVGDMTAPALGEAVERVTGPLQDGWATGAPYDIILIDGAVETIPPALVKQLAEGGRLAAAVLEAGVSRLSIGRRVGDAFGMAAFADAAAVALPGFAPPPSFTF
jgi:protein-L-isoaspartate(D-aspartate) O-methyltransferase